MIVGIVIIVVGLCCLLDNFGICVDWELVTSLMFIFAGIAIAIKNRKISLFPIILMLIGLWSILVNLKVLDVSLGSIFWPVMLILAGVSIIIGKFNFSNKVKSIKVNKDGKLIYSGIFGSVEEKVIDNNFDAIVVNSIFGGVNLDLTELKLKKDIKIEINSIFGGSDLLLSDDYNIVVSNISIFGGTDNKHKNVFDKNKKTININSVCVFGGTDLK